MTFVKITPPPFAPKENFTACKKVPFNIKFAQNNTDYKRSLVVSHRFSEDVGLQPNTKRRYKRRGSKTPSMLMHSTSVLDWKDDLLSVHTQRFNSDGGGQEQEDVQDASTSTEATAAPAINNSHDLRMQKRMEEMSS